MSKPTLALSVSGFLVFAGLLLSGCAKENEPADNADNKAAQVQVAADPHSSWWCREHGVPEDQCSICNRDVAAEFRAKGDWCEEHNRAESQCFLCDPSRAEKFAALYEAKFGEKPPKREDE